VLVAVGDLEGVMVNGITITGGNANGTGSIFIAGQEIQRSMGGGMVVSGTGNLALLGVIAIDNAASDGGADLLVQSDAIVLLMDTSMSGILDISNIDQGSQGGGGTPDFAPPKGDGDGDGDDEAEGAGEGAETVAPVAPVAPTAPAAAQASAAAVMAVAGSLVGGDTGNDEAAVSPFVLAGENAGWFEQPSPLAAVFGMSGWAPVNLVLVIGNLAIMLAIIYSTTLAASARARREGRMFACVASIGICLVAVVLFIASQDMSLAPEPANSASAWLVALTAANTVTVRLVGQDKRHKHLAPAPTAHEHSSPSAIRPRRGTWLTEEFDDEE
jgi:hypothetical protein